MHAVAGVLGIVVGSLTECLLKMPVAYRFVLQGMGTLSRQQMGDGAQTGRIGQRFTAIAHSVFQRNHQLGGFARANKAPRHQVR